jgi:hypothetical protein
MKSCDRNDETIWSHDWTKIEFGIIKRLFPFEIPRGDVDSLVILVIDCCGREGSWGGGELLSHAKRGGGDTPYISKI